MSSRDRRVVMRRLIVGSFGLIAVAVAAIGVTTWTMYSNATEGAAREVRNISTILAQETERAVIGIDQILLELQDHIVAATKGDSISFQRDLRTHELHDLLKQQVERLPQAYVIALLDQDGQLINSSQDPLNHPVSVADRDYFQYWKLHDEAGLFVGNPVIGRITGAQILFMSRRIAAPDGNFLGVIMVGVEIGYFKHVYESIHS